MSLSTEQAGFRGSEGHIDPSDVAGVNAEGDLPACMFRTLALLSHPHRSCGGQQEHPSSVAGCPTHRMGGSQELSCHILGVSFPEQVFFKPHRSTCSPRLRGMGCRRLSAGLALLQDNDSRDRVSPVLGAAAGVQGAEALVGCVHRLSLRRHADDRCVWVHVTGKSNGREASGCSRAC